MVRVVLTRHRLHRPRVQPQDAEIKASWCLEFGARSVWVRPARSGRVAARHTMRDRCPSIEELRPGEIAAKVRNSSSIAFVRVGPLHEWHSWHLPLGTDGLVAERLAEALAHRLDGVQFRAISLAICRYPPPCSRRLRPTPRSSAAARPTPERIASRMASVTPQRVAPAARNLSSSAPGRDRCSAAHGQAREGRHLLRPERHEDDTARARKVRGVRHAASEAQPLQGRPGVR